MCENRTRKAVGGIVFKDDKYLLVHKSKIMDGKNKPESIEGVWDFPKGGTLRSDVSIENALLRELKEETGSETYNIIKRYTENICFEFPTGFKYDNQKTIMFYVEYLGETIDLKPQDEEIDEIGFFNKNEVIDILQLEETKEFLKNINW